jgi:hypothetical protein
LKRIGAIATIVLVVLAMTAGTALASVCAGSDCGPAMKCESMFTDSCPMANGAPVLQDACGHPMTPVYRDAVSAPVAHEHGVAASPIAGAVVRPATIAASWAPLLVDARGAPHLTSVLRI